MVSPRYSRSSRAAIASSLCGSIGTSQSGQCCTPSLTNSSRRKCWISVSVPTVDLRPPRLEGCSIATVGGVPKIAAPPRARPARHHGEAAARDVDVDVLQVVLAGVVDADGARRGTLPPCQGGRVAGRGGGGRRVVLARRLARGRRRAGG